MNSTSGVAFFFDSDALIQILLTVPDRAFSTLKSDFGVTSFIMNEVEIEVRSNRKFSQIVRVSLDKALKSKSLRLAGSADFEALTSNNSSPISLADVREVGREYALYVGNGEAFTHAAGVLLNCPVVSNDINAIRTLEANGKSLPPTVLRSHDLFAFLHAENYLDARDGNGILRTLRGHSEWVPKCFEHASFEHGVCQFSCRLSTSLGVAASECDWAATFYLERCVVGSVDPESTSPENSRQE